MAFPIELSWLIIIVMIIAFLCEFMDSSLGMGYGTTLTPVLLLMGYEAAFIVPAVLMSEFVTGLVSAAFHAWFKNMTLGQNKQLNTRVDTSAKPMIPHTSTNPQYASAGGTSKLQKQSLKERINELTPDTKVIFILIIFGIFGTLISSIITAFYSYDANFKFGIKLYIGVMVLAMGILILALRRKQLKFSFKRIISIGAVAGFNKGISGGGYGPLTVSGQILSGREGKNAIATTSLSEGVICFVGALAYILTNVIKSTVSGIPMNWAFLGLAPFLISGAVLSAPLAALLTKKVENRWLKIVVGVVTLILGIFSLIKTILGFIGIW